MNAAAPPLPSSSVIQSGVVVSNRKVCRDHFRLTFRVPEFGDAKPGQFVHLCPVPGKDGGYVVDDDPWGTRHEEWWSELKSPLLRRAFSVAELVRHAGSVDADVLYRVVGTATTWLCSLSAGDSLSVMGPLGRPFPMSPVKPNAWLVAGGVGLPPLLWLAKSLNQCGKEVTAFCGAQSRDLLALEIDPLHSPAPDARTATRCSREFARFNASAVISTDDGSLGFRGHVGGALTAFAEANTPDPSSLVVYTCGPERMMRFVAEFCLAREIECHACVERNMACGTGMCQSCIVPVRDPRDAAGWRYQLCCTEGPVFDIRNIIWD